ncbi:phosphoribosylaminoimidazolesuccinocarboxamide synthase [Bacillus sonorensis]|uniref:phosphoribosylaminoimidazolesuccinocarboxamide synthase n=1 Tax=Bacillus sonorensis TaxID=119858 RepID=UPI0022817E87|nr:phosphoribosylaminoimidazolesuccinocarboxamide synthase [Bacillus sonorensis]MCZ0070754.1 phosphoribosylaminoimidazolesuccinocarboxamide synthase [Bacillus sonorensis]MCZ0098169.1 phosphoribosylaminoimidazolesuccinocarboxamide synthase [Bacillus sonorensis]MEC1519695.1 phosphoribosylaminoimidazolesuccinocarboxamide synthase [Bacillus sonorensis]
MNILKNELLYEGKAKKIFRTDDEDILFVEYKDSATAFNGEKKAEIDGKGRLNNEISSLIFTRLHEKGIANHFVKRISETEQLIKKVTIIPLEVVVRNVVAGSMSKRLGIPEGTALKEPIIEFYYKDDSLGDPLITEDHIWILQAAEPDQVETIKSITRQVNEELQHIFAACDVRLIDFKLEFGLDANGQVLLADEISPDTCRLWDKETNEKLDKDVFRRNLGGLTDAYSEIFKRLGGM